MCRSVTIQPIMDREAYLPFFLMADEDEEIVRTYIEEGDPFSIKYNHKDVGACLLTSPSPQAVEIKNIAISEDHRGLGIGKAVIQLIAEHCKERSFTELFVGTANSSIENLAFYQKAGFRFDSIHKGFFDAYPDTFYEHGIQGRDLIYFVMKLS
ncbi:GNAT family N-acetyltransferase [Halobacillus salinus]|uniref:GNAT family N-acetyltransferase n=1 Tax=Halobacillus salinus TaxID=192814 RepID=UPI0009A5B677|nr:GNAT family N-acetyltransferase [Halobacillus salinus]